MSDLYLRNWNRCKEELCYYTSCEAYLDVIEGKCDIKELGYSLHRMVNCFRCSNRVKDRALILIDEAGKPLLYADQYGYYQELKAFYDRFLDIDHYELDLGIVTTSYAPENVDVHYDLKYIQDIPVNEIKPLRLVCERNGINLLDTNPTKMYFFSGNRYFDRWISLRACFEVFTENDAFIPEKNDYEILLNEGIKKEIARKRKWIEKSRIKAEERRREEEARSKREYAAPLPEDCPIPSVYAGIRELHLVAKNQETLKELNSLLASMYDRYGKQIKQKDAYRLMQGFGEEEKSLNVKYDLKDMIAQMDIDPSCQISIDKDSHWVRLDCERGDRYECNDMALVKAYLSVANEGDLREVFRKTVCFLIQEGQHRFHAKAARKMRADQICLWVSREDFFRLENYVRSMDQLLIKPLPFVAYRGKIGISRELHSWDSHNGVQATLVSVYLGSVQDKDKIDVRDMYEQYVNAWNGDLEEGHALSREFKRSNAQEFIILMESIHCILGNNEIDDDHILLSGDSSMWSALGESKNWFEVGERIKEISGSRCHD